MRARTIVTTVFTTIIAAVVGCIVWITDRIGKNP